MSNLGFGRVERKKRRRTIYIGKMGKALWYFVNREGDTSVEEPIEHERITAVVAGVKVVSTEYEGKEKLKLQVLLDVGDEGYKLQTGLYTNAAKGLALGLKKAAEEGHAGDALAFRPSAGSENSKTVFMDVLNGDTEDKYMFEKGTWPRSEKAVGDLVNDCMDMYGEGEGEDSEVASNAAEQAA